MLHNNNHTEYPNHILGTRSSGGSRATPFLLVVERDAAVRRDEVREPLGLSFLNPWIVVNLSNTTGLRPCCDTDSSN